MLIIMPQPSCSMFCSLARSKYLYLSKHLSIFSLWSAGTATPCPTSKQKKKIYLLKKYLELCFHKTLHKNINKQSIVKI